MQGFLFYPKDITGVLLGHLAVVQYEERRD